MKILPLPILRKVVLFSGCLMSFLGFMQTSTAAITIIASDDGTDLTLNLVGQLNMTGTTREFTFNLSADRLDVDSDAMWVLTGSYYRTNSVGTVSGSDPIIALSNLDNSPTTGTGPSFGFNGGALFWDPSFGETPGTIAPTTTWTFANETVASVFGSNLDGGPVLLWTHNGTGDTISIGLVVPEPSTVLLGIGGAFCFLCCRRRNKAFYPTFSKTS